MTFFYYFCSFKCIINYENRNNSSYEQGAGVAQTHAREHES